jgi:hypothetical protein
MKAATSSEIKQELKRLTAIQLTELCLRLARFKKENKELLTYLLFEADNEEAYISGIKNEVKESFAEINTSSLYFAKKSIRKILRMVIKYIRYAGSKTVEAELLIHFCGQMNGSKIPFHRSPALAKLYDGQLKKINACIATMHEDLQYDYLAQVRKLEKD